MKEDNPNITSKSAVAQLVKLTNIGTSTIRKTLQEYKNTGTVTPPNRKKRRLCFKEKIDKFVKNAIRQKIHEFYINKELPTLIQVLKAVNADKNLPTYKRSTFHLLLKQLNFTFISRHHNSILIERDDIIIWRRNYLRNIKRYREEGRQIYYLDETWVSATDVTNRVWMNKTIRSKKDVVLRKLAIESISSTEKDKRLIVLHIGSAAGFVPGKPLCFISKKNAGDYYDEINSDTFLKWLKNILPLLQDNAVIVMDNAPYNSVKVEKIPNSTWKRGEIIKWLESKGNEIPETMVKAELLQIVQQQKDKFDKYVIDEIAEQYNKTILRLPPYHCELNPIQMVWSMIKRYVKCNNNTFKIQEVKLLFQEGIERMTTEHWRNFINYVSNEEKKMWEIDHIVDGIIDKLSPLIKTSEDLKFTSSSDDDDDDD